MALFEVDGWDIKTTKVKVGGDAKKPKKNKKRARDAEKNGQNETEGESTIEPAESEGAPKKKKTEKAKTQDSKPSNESKSNDTKSNESKSGPIAPMPAVSAKLTPLQQKMMAKLSGSRFRWINEQLYTTSSANALQLVKDQPALFDEYHQGFRSQVQGWPENPVDVFVQQFKNRTNKPVSAPGGLPGHQDKKVVVADMGCGEAQLALDINNFVREYNQKKKKFSSGPKKLDVKVHSFDLKKANERITVADIKNVPLPDESCNIVIFCLALMGTNFLDFIAEAYRILAPNGELWIAEIKSRFSESANAKSKKPEMVGEEFVESLKLLGFYHKKTDNDNKMFTRFEFFKPSREIVEQKREKMERRKKFVEHETKREELENRRQKVPEGEWLLKPCIYKRR